MWVNATRVGHARTVQVIDDTWIVQPRHGPFDPAGAPTTEGAKLGRSFDHWDKVLQRNGMASPSWVDEL